jgi:hypothetical protein
MAFIKSEKHISTQEFWDRRADLQQCFDHLEALDERFNAYRFTWRKTQDLAETKKVKELLLEIRIELEKLK